MWTFIKPKGQYALLYLLTGASTVAQMVKHLPAIWKTQVGSLGWEDPLKKEMGTHSSTLAWKIPWTEEPGGLQSMGLPRVGPDWATSISFFLSLLISINLCILFLCKYSKKIWLCLYALIYKLFSKVSGSKKVPTVSFLNVGMHCRRLRFDPWVGKIPWRKEWLPTPVLLHTPGKSHGQSLVSYSPWGGKSLIQLSD